MSLNNAASKNGHTSGSFCWGFESASPEGIPVQSGVESSKFASKGGAAILYRYLMSRNAITEQTYSALLEIIVQQEGTIGGQTVNIRSAFRNLPATGIFEPALVIIDDSQSMKNPS
jgi:hypothetical protein